MLRERTLRRRALNIEDGRRREPGNEMDERMKSERHKQRNYVKDILEMKLKPYHILLKAGEEGTTNFDKIEFDMEF